MIIDQMQAVELIKKACDEGNEWGTEAIGLGGDNVLACLAETIIMALESKKESLSIGRNLDIDVIKEIGQLGKKHGFSVNNLRSFGRRVKKETLNNMREVIKKQ